MGLFTSRKEKLALAGAPLGLAPVPASVLFGRWPFALREHAEGYRTFHRITDPMGGMIDGLPVETLDLAIDLPESSNVHRSSSTGPDERWLVAITEITLRGPSFSIQPRGFFGRIARGIGVAGIQLGVEEFDKGYHLVSNDRDSTLRLITPAFVQWLVAQRPRDLRVEIAGGGVLVARQGWGEKELPELIGALRAARDLMQPAVSPAVAMPARHCASCGAPLTGSFCGACGARAA